jgi:mRNA interferase MazF
VPLLAAGDVVVVPFPYTDRQTQQRRPAVVVSGPEIARQGMVWLLMVTSAGNAPWPGDVAVADLTSAGLPAPSVVRTAKIATVDSTHVMRVAGHLDATTRALVGAALRGALAI